MNTCFLS